MYFVQQITLKSWKNIMESLPLKNSQQYFRIAYLGFSFMVMFTSFFSLQNMVSKLYEDYNYKNLGQISLLVIYFVFGVCTVLSSYIVRKIGYKKSMFFSSLGFTIFQATGLLIVTEIQISEIVVWTCVLLGASINGLSAAIIWVAQGSYTSQVAHTELKSQLFGLFWALMLTSQILGSLLSTFVLGLISNLVYFIILILLGIASSFLFLFLPNLEKKQQQQQQQKLTLKNQIIKIWSVFKDAKYKYLIIYFMLPGITIAFYAGFLYKLVIFSKNQQDGEADDAYDQRLSRSIGYVIMALGAAQLFTGILMNRFSAQLNNFKLAIVGALLVQIAAFMSFACYYAQSFQLCFVCSFLWGISSTFLFSNTGALVAKLFPGRIEGFSLCLMFQSYGVAITILLIILLRQVDSYIFLIIILSFQAILTGVATNLKELDFSSSSTQQKISSSQTPSARQLIV